MLLWMSSVSHSFDRRFHRSRRRLGPNNNRAIMVVHPSRPMLRMMSTESAKVAPKVASASDVAARNTLRSVKRAALTHSLFIRSMCAMLFSTCCSVHRKRNLGLAVLGLLAGHGITVGGYMYMDRVEVPGTDLKVRRLGSRVLL